MFANVAQLQGQIKHVEWENCGASFVYLLADEENLIIK